MIAENKHDKKKLRQNKLKNLLQNNPAATDRELADLLGVSVSTVRLDRAFMGVPELRERLRAMVENAGNKLKAAENNITGELLELVPDKWALSVLKTVKDMAFKLTDIVEDCYIYSQASSIAVAVIESAGMIIDSMRGEYKSHAHVGDVLIARAKVGTSHDNKKIVSVHTTAGDKEIFTGRFILGELE